MAGRGQAENGKREKGGRSPRLAQPLLAGAHPLHNAHPSSNSVEAIASAQTARNLQQLPRSDRTQRRSLMHLLSAPSDADLYEFEMKEASGAMGDFQNDLEIEKGCVSPRGLNFNNALVKGTIFSPAAVADMEVFNPEALQRFQSLFGKLMQASLFFVCVLMGALTPNLSEWAKTDFVYAEEHPGEPTKLRRTFIDGVLIAMAAVLALVVMWGTTLWNDGLAGLRRCFVLKQMVSMGVPALVYGFGDVLNMAAFSFMDATSITVLKQTKIPLMALLCYIFLGRQLATVQWILLVMVVVELFVYVRVDRYIFDNPEGGGDDAGEPAWWTGFWLIVANIALVTPAAVVSDSLFKTTEDPFYIQLAQAKVSMFIAAMSSALIT
eukprot:Cvel_17150.t1-p1 / transcript=Cvel_17150.t1 / gene=Cvel_17150 / organism=Chromera_velia_CCMP2878 / gene_product=hypothetical protein / transcript_product=hypothetical protein / location=Cvel_scaffold1354:45823-47404(+) / protein_length=379 / sequence_SO=supercontig / SO=protein_coding / is_pseudo=false